MAAHAFACRIRFDPISGSPTSFAIAYQCIVVDGVTAPWDCGGTYNYDSTQTPAQNLAAFKSSIVAAASANGITLTAANVLVDIAMQ